MRLSIVIPAHNEEHRIGCMLDRYLPFFSGRYGADVEFIVVINGSTDDTGGVVGARQAHYPALRILVEPQPIGKGGALMMGFREARGDLVGFVDADGSTPPEAFQDLVDNIGDAGVIIASRWCAGAQVSPRQPLDRRLSSRAFNLITRILFGLRLTDTQCGAKLMQRRALQAVLPVLGITRWAFDVDLLFQMRRAGYKISEIPTVWHDVAGSKIQIGKASTEMILALTRLRLIYSPFKWVVSLYNRFFAPWIHPVNEERDHLFMHSLMLFVGAQFGNLCNLLFQVIMARMLGNADYGVLFAILSALMLLGLPLGSLGGAVTHFTALFMARDEREKIRAMMLALARDFMMPVVVLVLLVLLGGHELVRVFKLDSLAPVYLAVATVVVMLVAAVPSGVLAGMQAFEWVALIGNSWTALRLILGVILVWLGLGAVGGLTANMLGMMGSALLLLVLCASLLGRGRAHAERPAGLYSYMGGYMLTFAAYAVLSSTDVLWVKYYFPPDQAGIFAKATMVARMALFLPGPVCAAMFPKVTSSGDSSRANYRTLVKAMGLTGLISGGIGVVCLAFPDPLLRLLVREVQPGQVAFLRAMVLALAPLTLVMVLMNFELAQRRFRITIPLYTCAAGYIVGVMRWHETPLQIVTVLGVMSVLSLLLTLLVLPWRKMRQEESIGKG